MKKKQQVSLDFKEIMGNSLFHLKADIPFYANNLKDALKKLSDHFLRLSEKIDENGSPLNFDPYKEADGEDDDLVAGEIEIRPVSGKK